MQSPRLALIVLRASDPEATLAFYKEVGCVFREERHGSGPIHHSCQLGATVIEVYPGEPGHAPDRRQGGATILGFTVADLEATLARLAKRSAHILAPVKASPWGMRAVVADPDGRTLDLSQPNPSGAAKAAH